MEELTGYPSVDKPWLKYYTRENLEKAEQIPKGMTVWDVIEEKLIEYSEIPAIEYFGRTFSRKEFRELVYVWAKSFKALGIAENEVVPIYGPFVPDVCAMTFALNMIGATVYFLKLDILPEALEIEAQEAKNAIVFEGMWRNVSCEFSKAKYEHVILYSVTDSMPTIKKYIVDVLNKNKLSISKKEKKYMKAVNVKKLSDEYLGEVRVKYVANRDAFITSSSGTSIGGEVKGIVATNETMIAQLYMEDVTIPGYYPGGRCLTNFPPTASTSLNCLFLLPLYKGLTVVNDPRVSEKDFYNQIIELKPSIIFTTGSMWETFFARVSNEIRNGKKFDFSYAVGWVVGGEGTSPQKFDSWIKLLEECSARDVFYSGYGQSEFFAVVSGDIIPAMSNKNSNRKVLGVGIPYARINIGVFNQQGEELPYGTRGELYISSPSAMKYYYKKPELTAEIKADGWVKSGDIAEIDEKGFLYIWGRKGDSVEINGNTLYLFDVACKIMENPNVLDAIVLKMPVENNISLVAHIAWCSEDINEQKKQIIIQEIQETLLAYLPNGIEVIGYADHGSMLPYSPTTLKKDKNKMAQQLTGYMIVEQGELRHFHFEKNKDGKLKIEMDTNCKCGVDIY